MYFLKKEVVLSFPNKQEKKNNQKRLMGSRVWFSGDWGELLKQSRAMPQVSQSAEARGNSSGWIKAQMSVWEWEIDLPGYTISPLLQEEAFVA